MTPDLRVAYLIAGSDWPKVDAAISRLRAHFPEESVEQFSAGGDQPVDDQRAHHIAVLLLLDQVDRRRRPLLAAADVAQVKRLAEPALRLADQQNGFAIGLEGKRR